MTITQSFFKLGPPDFAWWQIQSIPTDNDNVHNDDDNDNFDDNDDHDDDKTKCPELSQF